MAITTRDGLVSAIAAGRSVQFQKANLTSLAAGAVVAHFRNSGLPTAPASNPASTGAALSRTSAGALNIPAPSGITYLSSFEGVVSAQGGVLLLADRLVEFGGLSTTVTTAQTVSAVSLPTRATSATDVELWLEVYTAGGATASASVTASYTNQSGTSGRTATLVGGVGASGYNALRTYPFALQAGDTGVQSVQSLTIGTSSGTAGNVGLTLRRTLQTGTMPSAGIGFTQGWAETDLQQIGDDACLELLHVCAGSTTDILLGAVGIAQG